MLLLKNKKDIVNWLNFYKISNYIIHPDMSVDVNDNVDISNKNLDFIPVKFNRITGFFDCSHNNFSDLSSGPKIVMRTLACRFNKIKSLSNYDVQIGWALDCEHNELTSLDAENITINGNLYLTHNPLTSFESLSMDLKGVLVFSNSYRLLDYQNYYTEARQIILEAKHINAIRLHKKLINELSFHNSDDKQIKI